MDKIDLKKKWKHLYKPSARSPSVVDVPEFQFAMVDGVVPAGVSPGEAKDFVQALEALYGVSYALKFKSKLRKQSPIDYTVMALEGLWWVESGSFDFGAKVPWYFTAMIMQPDHITDEMVEEALAEVKHKKPNPALDRMRFEKFHEGLSIQMMHIGPYTEEPRTLARMQAFAEENGYRFRGRHHEIYLGDPRRSKPENLRTVLRHPVEAIVEEEEMIGTRG